jgi:hypothetical protein
MSSKDPEEEPEYSPRPNDFLVEPLFAPLEKSPRDAEQSGAKSPAAETSVRGMAGRLWGWLRRRG